MAGPRKPCKRLRTTVSEGLQKMSCCILQHVVCHGIPDSNPQGGGTAMDFLKLPKTLGSAKTAGLALFSVQTALPCFKQVSPTSEGLAWDVSDGHQAVA